MTKNVGTFSDRVCNPIELVVDMLKDLHVVLHRKEGVSPHHALATLQTAIASLQCAISGVHLAMAGALDPDKDASHVAPKDPDDDSEEEQHTHVGILPGGQCDYPGCTFIQPFPDEKPKKGTIH